MRLDKEGPILILMVSVANETEERILSSFDVDHLSQSSDRFLGRDDVGEHRTCAIKTEDDID